MIWAGAKAAFFEMCCIQHDHEKLWSEERKLKGRVWYDVAKATLNAAENEHAEAAIARASGALNQGETSDAV